jgi:hypothetical protein
MTALSERLKARTSKGNGPDFGRSNRPAGIEIQTIILASIISIG